MSDLSNRISRERNRRCNEPGTETLGALLDEASMALERLELQVAACARELDEAQAMLITYGQQLTAAHVALTIIMDHSLEDNYLHKVAAKALGQREPQ